MFDENHVNIEKETDEKGENERTDNNCNSHQHWHGQRDVPLE